MVPVFLKFLRSASIVSSSPPPLAESGGALPIEAHSTENGNELQTTREMNEIGATTTEASETDTAADKTESGVDKDREASCLTMDGSESAAARNRDADDGSGDENRGDGSSDNGSDELVGDISLCFFYQVYSCSGRFFRNSFIPWISLAPCVNNLKKN